MLKGKNIVIGVTGGIAAYKTPMLVRAITKAGGKIRVVMTDSAKEFVTPLTLSTLSGNDVIVGTFPGEMDGTLNASTWHITLARWADVMVVAPATANTIAKLAYGYADNAVTTLALSLRCPLIISPAMDTDMLQHQTTEKNIALLREQGCIVLPPAYGELASGLVGPGRLPEVKSIVQAIDRILTKKGHDLQGKKIVITAGPTYEAIDPVRYLGNRSSGKMGFAIANAAAMRGADVRLITGPVHLQTPRHVKRTDIESAQEMFRAVMKNTHEADAVIMAAAVADFTPETFSQTKIKKSDPDTATLNLKLKKTKDILSHLSKEKHRSVLVGFSLETHHELRNSKKKLREKNLDLIVINNPLHRGAGFGVDTNIVTILSKSGKVEKLPSMQKSDVAHHILNRVSKLLSN